MAYIWLGHRTQELITVIMGKKHDQISVLGVNFVDRYTGPVWLFCIAMQPRYLDQLTPQA